MTLSRTLTASARLAELPAEVQDAVRADREQAEQRARQQAMGDRKAILPALDLLHYAVLIARDIEEGKRLDLPALLASAQARLDEVKETTGAAP